MRKLRGKARPTYRANNAGERTGQLAGIRGFGLCTCRSCPHGNRPYVACIHCGNRRLRHGGDCPRSLNRARRAAYRRWKKEKEEQERLIPPDEQAI